MAMLRYSLQGDFDRILAQIEEGILSGSISASLEERCDMQGEDSRCSVRVFERYSHTGQNRVSLSVTLYETGGSIQLFAAATGGSQALFFKVNTLGEEAFLDKLREVLSRL
ncbi:MAG: hypothetical protein IJP01_06745 [Oscillospiraceae bacterium]|nr:hypothetical protein [Oscillospiraceae bacterium]